jgi:PAS domain S-box-containing protein
MRLAQMKSERKQKRFPIWLTTFTVIVMIVLFSLMINQAREKEVVEQYGKQCVALARGTASGIEDLFDSVEKSMIILSRYHGRDKVRSNIQMIYEDLEGKVEFIARDNGADRLTEIFPETLSRRIMDKISQNPAYVQLVREVQRTGKPAISNLVSVDHGEGNNRIKEYRVVIIGAPEFDAEKRYSGGVFAVLSLSSIIERYLEPAKSDFPGDVLIADERGSVLFHPRRELIGADIHTIERGESGEASSLRHGMLKEKTGYGEYLLRDAQGKYEKSIVAYAPINLNKRRWSIAVITPYSTAISHVKKTFFIVMLEALLLIATVIIGSVIVVRSGKKRFILEEELKHLRERDRWREQLSREKRTIEGIIEGSPVPAFVINREHKVIFWNKACTDLTGYAGDEMIGTDKQYMPFYSEKRPVIADLIIDNNVEGLEKYYGRKSVRRSPVVAGAYEARDFFPNLGGKNRHLYFLAAPIYDEKGEIIAAVEMLQDVTSEKEMARSLKEYAAKIEKELHENVKLKKTIEGIIEGSPIPTFVINREHRIIFWNKACEELTGYTGEDMIGTDRQYMPFYQEKRPSMADLIVDNDMESLKLYYGGKRLQKSPFVEGAYEASDFFENLGGKNRHLYFLAAPIYDENEKIIAAIETLQDVTREEDMARNLREYAESLSNEIYELIKLRTDIEELYYHLQSILDSSPDRIFAIGKDGIVNYVSRRSTGKDGTSPKQMEGRYFIEFVVPEYREFMQMKWEEVKKGIYKPFEIEVSARDGSKRNLLITFSPIKGTDHFLLVQRNITEFKNLEKKFYESQKLAAVGQLSAGIAHEVRNPLSSIKMSLQILEKRLRPAGNDLKRFKIAEKEVEHLEKLVSDILIYAKPAEPELKTVDIGNLLESSLLSVEKELSEKKIKVQMHNDPRIPPVSVDGEMLKQAFINMYLNAIDAMDEGGTLTLGTKYGESGNRFLLIEIEDDGSGIDEQDIPHLFNPFFTRKRYGTGLGLTQVKKIVDMHHGTIEIFSKKQKGTKIVVTLPTEKTIRSDNSINDAGG